MSLISGLFLFLLGLMERIHIVGTVTAMEVKFSVQCVVLDFISIVLKELAKKFALQIPIR